MVDKSDKSEKVVPIFPGLGVSLEDIPTDHQLRDLVVTRITAFHSKVVTKEGAYAKFIGLTKRRMGEAETGMFNSSLDDQIKLVAQCVSKSDKDFNIAMKEYNQKQLFEEQKAKEKLQVRVDTQNECYALIMPRLDNLTAAVNKINDTLYKDRIEDDSTKSKDRIEDDSTKK